MDQFVNILGEEGQVYKFWDQMLKILFICIQKSNLKKIGGSSASALILC